MKSREAAAPLGTLARADTALRNSGKPNANVYCHYYHYYHYH